MQINVIVPSMGESITNAIISNWFVNDGDYIEKDSPMYELETDNQICMKTYLNEICLSISNTCLIHSCEEVKVPFYMFPSTKNLDAKQEYSLEEYKINNRIHLVIKMNTDGHQSVYIHYRHSKNADIDHCQSLISNLLDDLLEPI